MKKTKTRIFKPFAHALLMVLTLATLAIPTTVAADQPLVNFRSASSFAILAGSAITNTGSSVLNGSAGSDIGLHPGDDPTIETFPGQEDVTLGGTVHLFDEVAEQAKVDLLAAYNDAAGRTSDATIAADLGGSTLLPGVYSSESSILLTGKLTLDAGGDPNAVFIFQAGSTLTTASDSSIELINGAQVCNVFWQIGSSVTLGTGSTFIGHVMAMESITATTGTEVSGQLLAIDGAVTLDTTNITNDACTSYGSLRVSKEVQGSTEGITLPAFEITLAGPNDYSDTQVIGAGENYVWYGLSAGTYTVSENELGVEWTVEGTDEYQVEVGSTTDVTITNTYTKGVVESVLGSLKVTKIVTGNTTNLLHPNFEITVNGPNGFTATRLFVHDESYTWTDLAAGEYTVTENHSFLGSEWTVSGEGAVQVIANQTAMTTITNEYKEAVQIDLDDEELPDTSESSRWMTFAGFMLLLSGLFIVAKTKKSK